MYILKRDQHKLNICSNIYNYNNSTFNNTLNTTPVTNDNKDRTFRSMLLLKTQKFQTS